MTKVPKRVSDRISAGLKKYLPILEAAKTRDVGEADTVTIIKDMLGEVFGYDKYHEITSEFAIKGTYCDLAIQLDGKISLLIEAKAIGIELKEQHVKQAVDYAANHGVDWVLLTNGVSWRVYRLVFSKPIDRELVVDFEFLGLSSRSERDIETLYLLCKEGWQKSALGDYHTQKQALSKFFLGAMLQTDVVLDVIRRELKRVSPNVKIDTTEIKDVLINEVIKRDVLEGDRATEAHKKVSRAASKSLRVAKTPTTNDIQPEGSET